MRELGRGGGGGEGVVRELWRGITSRVHKSNEQARWMGMVELRLLGNGDESTRRGIRVRNQRKTVRAPPDFRLENIQKERQSTCG